ncbi:hypothetical protein SAMN05444714_2230 [Yoonia litorea]|uniref:Uncharacterized protein n=1 Tax=Yoonia litorea TaxID=1123755 RepID=A0A1I6MUY4_9RHOB|nr:hypothetical protein SAMN05444714_2230 [Yoonia litorea]
MVVVSRNGDVIRYDPTGLVMRLSDKVIDDIALRLDHRIPPTSERSDSQKPSSIRVDPHEHLEGIDAWEVRQDGEWLYFAANLPGDQGVRGFRRLGDGGDILGDAPGPLVGILGLGGPRAAIATREASHYPQHITAPADDIGAVGHAGVEDAKSVDTLEHLREVTHEALVAETFIRWQQEKYAAFPVFMTRVETDSSATSAQLANGKAFENFVAAASNLTLAAKRMGKKPKLMCVHLDYSLEDTSDDAVAYRDGMLSVMGRAEDALFKLGFENPVFVARMESGTAEITQAAAIEGQWELAWNHGSHRFLYSAPSYMFAHDRFERATTDARREMAEMTAAAIADPENWQCPTFYLAERTGDPKVIKVVAQSMTDLVVDQYDPFDAGAGGGFRVLYADNPVDVTDVSVDPDDSKALHLRLSARPEGEGVQIAYAFGAAPRDGSYPANCGVVRDTWQLESKTGRVLNRWALPCLLPLQPGASDA